MRLHLLAIITSLILCVSKSKADVPAPAKEVRVYDREHRLLVSITDAQQLETFYRLWSNRAPLPWESAKHCEFPYSIAGLKGGIWLYSADGITTKLDHITHRHYQVRNVAELNQILGILP